MRSQPDKPALPVMIREAKDALRVWEWTENVRALWK